MIPLNEAILAGPEYQEPDRLQRARTITGAEVVMRATLETTAVLQWPCAPCEARGQLEICKHSPRWLQRKDEVLVDADALRWRPIAAPLLAGKGARKRGRVSALKAKKRNHRVCLDCGRDPFQTPFYPNTGHKVNLCIECSLRRARARDAARASAAAAG